jgi:hypothetical protein
MLSGLRPDRRQPTNETTALWASVVQTMWRHAKVTKENP